MANSSIERKKLLSAKTPEEYVNLSIQAKLTQGEKNRITREWREKTGFSGEEIIRARNRNPYWMKKRQSGYKERRAKRIEKYNFARSESRKNWTETDLVKFYELNKKGQKDFELAKVFKTSLPAVYHIRRKINLVEKIFRNSNQRISVPKFISLVKCSERTLRQQYLSSNLSRK